MKLMPAMTPDSGFALVASACSSSSGEQSAVVMAISGDIARARSTLRFSLGENTTKAELVQVVLLLAAHIVRNVDTLTPVSASV